MRVEGLPYKVPEDPNSEVSSTSKANMVKDRNCSHKTTHNKKIVTTKRPHIVEVASAEKEGMDNGANQGTQVAKGTTDIPPPGPLLEPLYCCFDQGGLDCYPEWPLLCRGPHYSKWLTQCHYYSLEYGKVLCCLNARVG